MIFKKYQPEHAEISVLLLLFREIFLNFFPEFFNSVLIRNYIRFHAALSARFRCNGADTGNGGLFRHNARIAPDHFNEVSDS